MSEVKNEVLEALDKALEDCCHNFAAPDAENLSNYLAERGFTIAPIAQPVADEKLREAVDIAFSTITDNVPVASVAGQDWEVTYETAKAQAKRDLEAALAELAERRAEIARVKSAIIEAQVLYGSADKYTRNRGWHVLDAVINPTPPATGGV